MDHKITVKWNINPLFPNVKQPSVEYSTSPEKEEGQLWLTVTLMFDSRPALLGLDGTNKAIRSKLRESSLGWIWFARDSWFLDLDLLRERFAQLRGETWLRGVVSIPPQYNSIEPEPFCPPDDYDKDIYTNIIYLFVNPDRAILRKVYPSTPIEIKESLQAFRTDHPSPQSSAFIMMRFSGGRQSDEICKAIRQTMELSNIQGLRADDKLYHDDLYWNIMTYIYGCGSGVAVFERIESDTFNPNVSLEVGYMLALSKPICLLKDQTLKALHTDLIGKLYQPFDVYNPSDSIPPVLNQWLLDKGFKQN